MLSVTGFRLKSLCFGAYFCFHIADTISPALLRPFESSARTCSYNLVAIWCL
jgi:hypothetical protein